MIFIRIIKKIYRNIKYLIKYFGKYDSIQSLETKIIKFETVNKGTKNGRKIDVLLNESTNLGTCADYIIFLAFIEQSIRNNRIPIIDRKTLQNLLINDKNKTNTWTLFFKQPYENIDYNNEDDIRRVFVSGDCNYISLSNCNDKDVINYWRQMALKYASFKPDIKNRLDIILKSYIPTPQKTLGVYIRMGYAQAKWKGHSKQPSINQIIEDIKIRLTEWNLEYVYIVHDVREVYEEIQKKLPEDKLIHIERKRPTYNDANIIEKLPFEDMVQREFDYLSEIYCFSKCNSIMGTKCSGVEMAFLLSNGFEHSYIYELGVY